MIEEMRFLPMKISTIFPLMLVLQDLNFDRHADLELSQWQHFHNTPRPPSYFPIGSREHV